MTKTRIKQKKEETRGEYLKRFRTMADEKLRGTPIAERDPMNLEHRPATYVKPYLPRIFDARKFRRLHHRGWL
jgi:hypothetical protein